jgi:hypothetical protein
VSDVLRSFRRNAVHARQALALLVGDAARVQVEGGYLDDAGRLERFKLLSIPVRRALNATDRASIAQALTALRALAASERPPLEAVEHACAALAKELETSVGFGGSKVPRAHILGAWLDAAAFYDKLDRDRAYDRMIDQWGKAAESIGSQLTEQAARVVLLVDEAAAAALGEPVILPPPPKTPPPPPDPREPWWRRLMNWKKNADGDTAD